MRLVFFDTETTGLRPGDGHRIIEIACVEVVDRSLTDRHYHVYLNPEREIDEGAVAVHGMTWEMLKDKPKFADVAEDFLAFIADAEIVAHNAPFDVAFLNAELGRLSLPPVETCCLGVIDTLAMARSRFPAGRCSLDDLCQRFNVDRSKRTLHGALIDSELLAQVYLAMTRGQETLDMVEQTALGLCAASRKRVEHRPIRVIFADEQELAAHRHYLDGLKKAAQGAILWHEEDAGL